MLDVDEKLIRIPWMTTSPAPPKAVFPWHGIGSIEMRQISRRCSHVNFRRLVITTYECQTIDAVIWSFAFDSYSLSEWLEKWNKCGLRVLDWYGGEPEERPAGLLQDLLQFESSFGSNFHRWVMTHCTRLRTEKTSKKTGQECKMADPTADNHIVEVLSRAAA